MQLNRSDAADSRYTDNVDSQISKKSLFYALDSIRVHVPYTRTSDWPGTAGTVESQQFKQISNSNGVKFSLKICFTIRVRVPVRVVRQFILYCNKLNTCTRTRVVYLNYHSITLITFISIFSKKFFLTSNDTCTK